MNKFLMGAAALAMTLPGAAMAADGMLGSTSEATFTATMTVTPPNGTDIQIVGLDDFAFGTVATSGTVTTTVAPMTDFICLNHSGIPATFVQMTIEQVGGANGQPFKLKAATGSNGVGLTIFIVSPGTTLETVFSQTGQGPQPIALSESGCTASTTSSLVANQIRVTPAAISAGAAAETGVLSAMFTIKIASPS